MIQAVRERRLANGDNVQMSGGRKAIKFGVTPTWRNSIPYYVRLSPAAHATPPVTRHGRYQPAGCRAPQADGAPGSRGNAR